MTLTGRRGTARGLPAEPGAAQHWRGQLNTQERFWLWPPATSWRASRPISAPSTLRSSRTVSRLIRSFFCSFFTTPP